MKKYIEINLKRNMSKILPAYLSYKIIELKKLTKRKQPIKKMLWKIAVVEF